MPGVGKTAVASSGMKPATNTLAQLFNTEVRYVVPLYQRPYVWKKETHWRPLWEDVVGVIERQMDPAVATASHFLGAVVLDMEETTPGEATRRLVIDGQQRLTTLQLLLSATASEAEQAGAAAAGRVLRRLTLNDPDLTSGDARFKVWPTNANQVAFRAVMNVDGGATGPDNPHNTVHEAHAFFRQCVRAWTREDQTSQDELVKRFDALRVALTDLFTVVSINLEQGDNAQVIFETLNARGTPLLAMDLVKNALFYRASLAGIGTDALHDGIWHPELGSPYWREDQRQGRLKRPRAELFLMHWLAMKLGRIVPATELFSEFRTHVLGKTEPTAIGELVKEICADAAVMRSFDTQPIGSVEARFFATLAALDTTTVLPLALLLFRSPTITPEQRRNALLAIESWLVRRMLGGFTSKNYNKTGAELLAAARQDPAAIDASIINALAESSAATNVWPTDDGLTRVLVTRPMYRDVKQSRVVMVLSAIELERRRNGNKIESVFTLPPKLTLEHLLPQKWREHWALEDEADGRTSDELEAARDAVLHRLGNLTVTSGPLNSSLSNGAWATKGPAIHAHSLLMLNAEVSRLPSWDVDNINRRGFSLAAEICQIWPPPSAFGVGAPEPGLSLEAILTDAAAAAAAPGPRAAGGGVALDKLVEAGYVEEGETLTPARESVDATATVLADGRLECGELTFDTPSAAAVHCAGTSAENGWTFWLAERDGELIALRDIRTQFRGAGTPGAGPPSHAVRVRFWSGVLHAASERTQLHARVSPTTDSWLGAGAGFSGVHFIYGVKQRTASVYLCFEDRDASMNQRIFDALFHDRDAIEQRFGGPLVWDAKEGRKRRSVGASFTSGLDTPEQDWPAVQALMVDAMAALEGAVSPYLSDAVAAARIPAG